MLESPLDNKEIQPVHPKGNQSWIFTGLTDAEAEAPALWPPDRKNWLIRKDLDAGKNRGQEEKGLTEDELVGWHHWLKEYESEQAPGVGDGQGSLACYSPWGRKELDMTKWLNWTELAQHLLAPKFYSIISSPFSAFRERKLGPGFGSGFGLQDYFSCSGLLSRH